MASPSGTSSGSSLLQNSGSEGDLQQLIDQKKRKRMISNRESARRSRMRKQKHLDDLMAQVAQLRKENQQIISSVNVTTHHFLNVEADNSILRAQIGELSRRLESLNEILSFLNAAANNNNNNNNHHNNNRVLGDHSSSFINEPAADTFVMNTLNLPYLNQPILASLDMFQY